MALLDDRGDEKAGDHEEHVDADVPALKTGYAEVEYNDTQHGDRSETIYVGAIVHRLRNPEGKVLIGGLVCLLYKVIAS